MRLDLRRPTPGRREPWKAKTTSVPLSGDAAVRVKDSPSQADNGGTLLDCHLEIVGHPHRQPGSGRLDPADPVPHLDQFPEVGTGVLRFVDDGHDRHDADQGDAEGDQLLGQGLRLFRDHARLLGLPAHVHLEEGGRRGTGSLQPGFGQRHPVHGMEDRGDGPHDPGLVRLEVSDEVPADVGWQLGGLAGQFVGPVLAEVSVSVLVETEDRVGRATLAHRHHRDLRRIPTHALTGAGDPLFHRLQAHATHPKAAIRSGVASRRWLKPPPQAVQRPSAVTEIPGRRRRAAATRSTEVVPQVVRLRSPSKRAATSSPTSKQHGPMAGPIQASTGADPISAIRSAVASRTPAANPRQPAWATPTVPGPAMTTPRQSAVNTATGRPGTTVTMASAGPTEPGPSAVTTFDPWTWSTVAHSSARPSFRDRRARASRSARMSPSSG